MDSSDNAETVREMQERLGVQSRTLVGSSSSLQLFADLLGKKPHNVSNSELLLTLSAHGDLE